MKQAEDRLKGEGTIAFIPVFRCFFPGDDEYESAAARTTIFGMKMQEVHFAPAGVLQFGDGEASLATEEAHWLAYLMAKSAWRMEPELREKYGGPDRGELPSVEEEIYGLAVAAGAYLNAQTASEEDAGESEETEPFQAVPFLDRLVEAIRSDQLRGFVLFEVIHKTYGIPLEALDEAAAGEVSDYVIDHVIVRAASHR
jgi:hypothetical protein